MMRAALVAWRRLRQDASMRGWVTALRHAIRLLNAKVRDSGWRGAAVQLRGLSQGRLDAEAAYAAWIAVHLPSQQRWNELRAEQAEWRWRPVVSIVTPVYNTPPQWLRACIDSVTRQAYPLWQLCLCDDGSTDEGTLAVLAEAALDPRISVVRLPKNAGISAASNAALAAATGEIIALLDHDDEYSSDALIEVVRCFAARADVDVLYSDEDKIELDGRHVEPYFKPDWSPEHFMGTMYTCHLTAARRSAVDAVGGFRVGFEGAQDYDLWLRLMERPAPNIHVPRVLYHWRKIPGSAAASSQAKPWALDAGRRALADAVARRGVHASVEPGFAPGNYRVRYAVSDRPSVSCLIPTRGAAATAEQAARVAACLRSIIDTTGGVRPEIVCITEDGSLPAAVTEAVRGVAVRVIADTAEAGHGFNFSRRINLGVADARGDFLLLLNDDVSSAEVGWLEALLEYAAQPEVGAVGPRLDYPDGRVQHVGMLIGVRGLAAHAFHQAPGDSTGYFGSIIGPRNFSALTGACLLTRRRLFDEVHGLDEGLPVDYNDIDFCLKLAALGYRHVYTPFARLCHHEQASTGVRVPDGQSVVRMRERWGARLTADPFYNPHLSRDFCDYRLGSTPRKDSAWAASEVS